VGGEAGDRNGGRAGAKSNDGDGAAGDGVPAPDDRADAATASRCLRALVWLTPFDLGIRQQLTLLVHPGRFPDAFEVRVTLRRLSGDPASWYRMNHGFLAELRKQLLQWRSLSQERMQEYIEESKGLFRAAETDGTSAEPLAHAPTLHPA
jgi:hypothetical protein